MDFIWNDGGRAASGFVGVAGDCVSRALAIATGTAYRDVYQDLGAAAHKTPRNGVRIDVAADYLKTRDWKIFSGNKAGFSPLLLPDGVVLVHLADRHDRSQHMTTVIDHVVHDTWNPADDGSYLVQSYWTSVTAQSDNRLPSASPKQSSNHEQELTQSEFDKILKRLRALDRTASNGGSTEGEKHNALRMMQNLMLRHNLSREDIVDQDNVEHVQFTRIACPVNGRRACNWEKHLAAYVTDHIFPTTQWFIAASGHRTLFWFYGPVADVKNTIALFRELLLTIATAAQLQFGGHSRGSGASYAEGYVEGLPRKAVKDSQVPSSQQQQNSALIQARTLTLHTTALEWLALECNIRLTTVRRAGRSQRDPNAEKRGKRDGSTHEVTVPNAPKRLT
ncbi:DUF2786 domain-containing protein [Aureliella helgolandensis]|uniref:Uncharacterized protein n=1 Tax=Aureliella helgolandensis TaxID=2527968 RepID=A0A518G0L3_9BACT|nr:DUF2786 domain-containing protein [Aureliella helgolandensis]QDV22145.1 hypothetical protein Q31a_04280 [Aureliella helgolandensis]